MPTFLRNIYPLGTRFEGVLVGVEASKRLALLWRRAMLIGVHRRIVLMTKSNCIARLAIPVGLRTLPADRPQFVTLQLSLAAGQAGRCVS